MLAVCVYPRAELKYPWNAWFPIIQDHVEGYLELAAKTKAYFVAAVSMWDAEYYIKVDDDVHVNIGVCKILPSDLTLQCSSVVPYSDLGKYSSKLTRFCCTTATLGNTLARHRSKPRAYVGCMKSGPVLAQK